MNKVKSNEGKEVEMEDEDESGEGGVRKECRKWSSAEKCGKQEGK